MDETEADATYVREPRCVAYGLRDLLIVTTSRGVAEFRGREAATVRALLASMSQEALRRSGGSDESVPAGEQGIVAKLVEIGALRAHSAMGSTAALAAVQQPKPCQRLVVAITGAVQTTDILVYIDHLARHFADDIEIVLTPAAHNFVETRSFDYLYGRTPWVDEFEARGVRVPHVHLARWAQLVVVLPTTAHTLQKLATGACSDLVSLVVATTRAPVVLVPAMNPEMWASAAVQRNVDRVRDDGMIVIEPGYGFEAADPTHGMVIGGPGVAADQLPSILTALLIRVRRDAPQ